MMNERSKTMAKNILLGNSVNVQFSGTDEYKNWAILERLKKKWMPER
ncbi:MAG: hypothetical protein LUH14_06220 [Clostridiaceae bacterium]|nr:hypothetical protein [Clostridiaceae bacterium]